MQLRKSSKKQAKIKLAIQGCSGSGKTFSALQLAYGLCGDWSKIAVVDSENNSADLYANLGDYNVLPLEGIYTPETYIEAIRICEQAGMEVIIIDSMSQCWDYLLEYHSSLPGNSFTNWQKVTPRMNALMQAILQSKCHIISTMRCKQDYVLSEKNGKMVPEKVGLKAVMRDGIDYEYTIVFDVNMKHQATTSKDRTNLFVNQPEFVITPETGKAILDWCNDGITIEAVIDKINSAQTVRELGEIYGAYPEWRDQLLPHYMQKKEELYLPKRTQTPNQQPQTIHFQPTLNNYNHADLSA
ncbi:MAG: AAA family ATPase [Muribaculaceae bacterium]|nr:AAA family ATPase [Muribaculaceae bacterium]